jgi:hypothetical protein
MRKMRRSLRLKAAVMLLASLGMAIPRTSQAAGPSAPATGQSVPSTGAGVPLVVDVALGDGGRLSGQVLDRAGLPGAGKSVFVLQQGRLVASTRADADGRFTVDRLTGGVYEVQSDGGISLSRMWAAGTAPPAARPTLLVTSGDEIVRGQHTFGSYSGGWMKGPGPWIIAVAAIVAVPTALALTLRPKSSAS